MTEDNGSNNSAGYFQAWTPVIRIKANSNVRLKGALINEAFSNKNLNIYKINWNFIILEIEIKLINFYYLIRI